MGTLTSNEINKDKNLIFLVGFMGCGKTTLGKKVAQKTGYSFIDLDELITQQIGTTITQYFETFGEAAFRQIEKETLHSLKDENHAIIATGGGTPCHFENMEWMNQHGKTIYIKLSPKALLSRLSQTEIETRPLLIGKSNEELLEFITPKLEERKPFYSQAKIVFDALQSTPKDLIKQIIL
ncbi:MAG TPA: shikimate kinase [Sphingobacteriaceae bacterium]|nr:shikimate kinase [Sphingobacteriaceae bacterium]